MPNEKKEISFVDAIREGTAEAMREDDAIILYGLGVNDPGRVFGTTAGLLEEFGPSRVFEPPTAENAMTGIAVGAALGGLRPIVTHQRFDFFLLAMDQLVNSAAKWRYMFGGQFKVPLVFRLITGRGWGQGPTHSQSYHSWLANVPGLKVVAPSSPLAAKSLIKEAIQDDNPVVFIENRWCHHTTELIEAQSEASGPGGLRILRQGDSITVVAFGYSIIEAHEAADKVAALGVSCEIIDLGTLAPLPMDQILSSVSKTGRLLVIDQAPESGSLGAHIIWQTQAKIRGVPVENFGLLALRDLPEPTSFGATAQYHINPQLISQRILEMVGLNPGLVSGFSEVLHDQPPSGTLGPF